jgi:cyclopropane fatty-acyl-phospholipid synthase-like methyltransferase
MSRQPAHFEQHYDTGMREMFAAVSDLYARYWGEFFHFTIFDNGEQSWEQAIQKTHQRYMDDIRLGSTRRVIELACGRGGFSNILAQNTQGDVLGVDIAAAQLAHARRYERPNLRFEQHDIMHIDELGETFDAVVLMDAACYLPDKAEAVSKISRIMRPGARFLLIEWCKREGLNRFQEELVLQPFMDYWAVPGLETMAAYKKYFIRAGLTNLKMEDLTPKVRRNWESGYDQAVRGIRDLSFRDIAGFAKTGLQAGRRGIRLIKEQFAAAIYIKAGFDTGFLRYACFLVEKPGDE